MSVASVRPCTSGQISVFSSTRPINPPSLPPPEPLLFYPPQERQQFAAVAALANEGEGEEDGESGDKSAVEPETQAGAPAKESGGGGGDDPKKSDDSKDGDDRKEGDDDSKGGVVAKTIATQAEKEEAEVQSGWYVLMEVQLHVSSGLHVKVTDLDIAVLQGIATSLIDSLGVGASADANAASPSKGGNESAAGKSLTYALDKAQRRMVASLRQAFRLADVNGDGTLDRGEVEGAGKTRIVARRLMAVARRQCFRKVGSSYNCTRCEFVARPQ